MFKVGDKVKIYPLEKIKRIDIGTFGRYNTNARCIYGIMIENIKSLEGKIIIINSLYESRIRASIPDKIDCEIQQSELRYSYPIEWFYKAEPQLEFDF